MSIRSITAAAIIAASSFITTTPAHATPTTFTYQGHLVNDGQLADGIYEFQIRLLDDIGTQIGSTEFANVVVSEGTFTLDLDFGPSAFDGSERFLEFAVRSVDDGGSFVTLSPNQRVNATPATKDPKAHKDPKATRAHKANKVNQDKTVKTAPTAHKAPKAPKDQKVRKVLKARKDHKETKGPQVIHIGIDQGHEPITQTGMSGSASLNDETAIYALSLFGTGIRGQSTKSEGIGIFGQATAPSGNSIGGLFETHSTTGTGLRAYAYANSGTNYAIQGSTNSASGYAGYFEGGRNYFEGRVGVGTTSPTDEIHINAPAGESAFRVQHDGLTRIRVNANGGVSLGGNSTIVPAGDTYVVNNLGVGENEPSAKLHVNAESGRVPLEVLTNGTRRMHISSSGGITLGDTGSAAAGDVYIVNDLGVGDSTPNAKLHVRGSATQTPFRVDKGDGNFALIVSSAGTVTVDNQISIGTASAHSFELAVSGSAAKTGGGSWSVFSDQRLKKNITPMQGSLETLTALRPVNFEYTNKDHFSYAKGIQQGFIAQEVQQVIPQWVHTADDGYLYLDQTGFEALVVGAIQELRSENAKHIQELQAENDQLRSELEQLKQMVRYLIEN
ncbi:unnamed protein product [Symbiodinium sp. CCMP2592]|nr:unnamed protein product [Symbiodinium sp. CCMP2592]